MQNNNSKIKDFKKIIADIKHPKEEKTVVLIKPDAVKRGLIGEIIKRFESRGFKIVALKMLKADKKKFEKHYTNEKNWIINLGKKTVATYEKYGLDPKKELGTNDPYQIGKKTREWLIDFMVSGPIVKMIVEGVHAVDAVRKIVGETQPSFAQVGTIRGDFATDSPLSANKDKRAVYNLVHASGTKEEALNEILLWFNSEEICDYKRAEELI